MFVDCPTCKTSVEWTESNTHRPFCSDRCRLIDLGAWASEDYRIASGEPVSEDHLVEALHQHESGQTH
ncbi:MAG: DNA gyrase inhibitor YacG [Marinobacter sp.]